MENTTQQNQYFNFEIYTCNDAPVKEGIYKGAKIGEISGWDIKMVSVKADTKQEARQELKKYPLFDCIILFNFQHKENETANFLVTETYPEFKIIERIN
jgi:hypothetical protein